MTSTAPDSTPGGTLAEITSGWRGQVHGTLAAVIQYLAALGPAASAPPEALARLAENDSRSCDADCGERIYCWQPSWPVSFDPDLRACSAGCAERMEDQHAGSVRETCEELAAEAVRESAGGWPV